MKEKKKKGKENERKEKRKETKLLKGRNLMVFLFALPYLSPVQPELGLRRQQPIPQFPPSNCGEQGNKADLVEMF